MSVALVALFVALAGTATAATLITNEDLAKNAVTSSKVKNRSLRAVDFKRGTLRRGARGFTGAPGRPGAPGSPGHPGRQGPPGPTALYTYVSEEFENPDDMQSEGSVTCDPGEYATGGGVYTESEVAGEQTINSSGPAFTDDAEAPDAWKAFVDNNRPDDSDDETFLTFQVFVTCAPATDVGVFGKQKLKK
jgi:hypothetical protein